MLDWHRVDGALSNAPIYWLATVSEKGRPHSTPIWGAWARGHLYFEGGNDTRWARNLVGNPHIAVGVDSEGLHITVNGRVSVVHPAIDVFTDIAKGYGTKYDYRPEQSGSFYRVSPATILAHDMATVEDFAKTPTRFTFEEG